MAISQKISFKEINNLALPAIVAGIAEPLISLTDIAIIGNVAIHPVESLAAAGIAGSFLTSILWIVAQTKTAISSIVSQHLGSDRLHAVKTLIPQTLLFNFLLSLLIYAVTAFFAESIFRAYNADGLILDYTSSYYRIRAIGYPITLVTFAIFGVFRGLQNTLWAMKCSIAGALANVVLDFILVYGIDGVIPPGHLKGAAYASVISQGIMLCMALYYYFTKTPFSLHVRFRINPKLKPLLQMSRNLFIRTAALNFAIFLANAYATDYGKNTIAAQSILMNIWLFFSFFIDGYSNAGNAISGKLLGAGQYHKLWTLAKDLCRYAIIAALVLILCCSIFYFRIGSIFNKDETVLHLFASAFWMVLLMQPINAVAFVFDGIFKGLGEAAYLRNLLLVATFLGFWPILFIADRLNLQLYGIWIAFIFWMLLRAGGLIIKFKRKYVASVP